MSKSAHSITTVSTLKHSTVQPNQISGQSVRGSFQFLHYHSLYVQLSLDSVTRKAEQYITRTQYCLCNKEQQTGQFSYYQHKLQLTCSKGTDFDELSLSGDPYLFGVFTISK